MLFRKNIMKNCLFFFVLLISSCKTDSLYISYPQTYYSKASGTNLAEVERSMIKELYSFYTNSDKKHLFYEVNFQNRMLVNFNPADKILFISNDLCSGIAGHFANVEEKDLKFLSENSVSFLDYPKHLTPSKGLDYANLKLQTNAPCLRNK
jgi:hypothetical protein